MNEKKVIVVYSTKYGSTKKYAEWIAQEANADIKEASKIKVEDLEGYDTIVFGGGIYAVGISGFKLIKNNFSKLKDKRIIVFSVGLAHATEETIENVRERNLTEEMKDKVEVFILRGAFNAEKLNFFHKNMMKLLAKKIKGKKQEEWSDEERGIVECMEKPLDFTDKGSIEPIVNSIKN